MTQMPKMLVKRPAVALDQQPSLSVSPGEQLLTIRSRYPRFSSASYASPYRSAIEACDPQPPWQRGSNENTNGLLRKYFPREMASPLGNGPRPVAGPVGTPCSRPFTPAGASSRIYFPVAGDAKEGSFIIVFYLPDFTSWGEFLDAYPGSAVAEIDEGWDETAPCENVSALWNAVDVE